MSFKSPSIFLGNIYKASLLSKLRYRVIPLGDINNSDDIINILFNYVKDNFDKFGHQEPDWWWNTDYGSSWSPFVEACFILYGEKNQYQIHHSFTHPNITDFMRVVHCKKYDHSNKHTIKGLKHISDINLLNSGICILSLEHSEDGEPIRMQLDNIFEEIDKLKDIPDGFKVLISRPQPFDRHIDPQGYSQSICYFEQEIQNRLMNDSGQWLIILIAPYPDDNPHEIIFYCYEWKENALHDIDENHEKYTIPIKQVTKWIKVE